MKTETLKYIVEAIRERAPGPGNLWFTVSHPTMMDIEWSALVGPPIEKFICEEVEAIFSFDEHGNYQFQLTRDAVLNRMRKEIRSLVEYPARVGFYEDDALERTMDRVMRVIERNWP